MDSRVTEGLDGVRRILDIERCPMCLSVQLRSGDGRFFCFLTDTKTKFAGDTTIKTLSAQICLTVIALLVLLNATAQAATTTSNLTVNTTIAARAILILGSASVNFPDSDPTSVPSIGATENPVSVTARIRTGSASVATLTAQTGGDLVSGGNTIAISNVTWTATGTGFVAGTMNKAVGQPVGSWTGSGEQTGSNSYFLANSWNYATGVYTATVTYTLTAP